MVAAETQEIANKAIQLIEVDYEVLPHVLDAEKAMQDDAPVIHDENDSEGNYDAGHTWFHHIEAEVGNIEHAFERS